MEEFHHYLRAHREKRGIRLEEIASITKIHLRSLQLLESGHWHELPPEPFIRGFLIAYAKYVGLEPKEMLERYYTEIGRDRIAAANASPAADAVEASYASDVIEHSRAVPLRALAGAFALVVVFGVVGVLVVIGQREDSRSVATTQSETSSAAPELPVPASPAEIAAATAAKTTPAGTAAETAKPVAEATPAMQRTPLPPGLAHEVQIEIGKRTWMKVVVDGDRAKEMVLDEGTKKSFTAKQKIKVVLANGDGAKVFHNGDAQEGVPVRGSVRSYRFPANAQFPQDVPPPKPEAAPAPAAPVEEGAAE